MKGREGHGGWESAEAECSLARTLKMCFERMPRRSQLVVDVPDKNTWARTERNRPGPNCEDCWMPGSSVLYLGLCMYHTGIRALLFCIIV